MTIPLPLLSVTSSEAVVSARVRHKYTNIYPRKMRMAMDSFVQQGTHADALRVNGVDQHRDVTRVGDVNSCWLHWNA